MTMDEFSWFVGIFEGEGCITTKDKKQIMLAVTMTDEDTIQRCAKFLGVSYRTVPSKTPRHKTQYRVRKVVGRKRGHGRDLILKMYPHLSTRRQQRIGELINL